MSSSVPTAVARSRGIPTRPASGFPSMTLTGSEPSVPTVTARATATRRVASSQNGRVTTKKTSARAAWISRRRKAFGGVFTVEQRDAVRERVLRLAEEDDRVIAGAAVGSLAVDEGDRFSDLDLTFGIADHVAVTEVLGDWTATLIDELGAVQLVDLERGPTMYRVFLLPDALQFDLSMT